MIVDMEPGYGATAADWLAYAEKLKRLKDKFGDPKGVLAFAIRIAQAQAKHAEDDEA